MRSKSSINNDYACTTRYPHNAHDNPYGMVSVSDKAANYLQETISAIDKVVNQVQDTKYTSRQFAINLKKATGSVKNYSNIFRQICSEPRNSKQQKSAAREQYRLFAYPVWIHEDDAVKYHSNKSGKDLEEKSLDNFIGRYHQQATQLHEEHEHIQQLLKLYTTQNRQTDNGIWCMSALSLLGLCAIKFWR